MLPIEQFHPLVVHFPIVFALLLAIFDAGASLRGAPIGGRAAVANVSTAIALCAGVFAAIAFVFGDLAFDVALGKGTPLAVLETHEELGKLTAAVLFAWAVVRSIIWWRNLTLSRNLSWVVVIIEFVVAGLIVATAYFGGQLVYEFGVGVSAAGAAAQ
ncbi:DUF2231 domain-containing protein [uncultured Porticoccus sp.]|uniref:DUF2231 domain-containing protein n=1 Tax=uncultured Porticoccus sp. TaxID=1256050 RepID=UPI0030D95614